MSLRTRNIHDLACKLEVGMAVRTTALIIPYTMSLVMSGPGALPAAPFPALASSGSSSGCALLSSAATPLPACHARPQASGLLTASWLCHILLNSLVIRTTQQGVLP